MHRYQHFGLILITISHISMDVSSDLTYLQGIQASFRRGLVLPRVAASTESQIYSSVLKRTSESVSFSFARYINGKCKKGVHSQVVTIFLLPC